MLKRYLKLFREFLGDPLWTLEYFFKYKKEGKNFKHAEKALLTIAAIKEHKTKTGKLLTSVFQLIKSPLRQLSRYFHTGEGQNLKYAKQARQTITFIQNLKCRINDFFGSVFGFLFDIGKIVIPWVGRAVVWLFKAIITTTVVVIAGYLLWEVATNTDAIALHFQLRWWESKLFYGGVLVILSMFVSVVDYEIWNLKGSFGVLVPVNVMVLTIASVIVGFGLFLTAPL